MAKVGLVGYFGWGNFGDELMLDVWRSAFSGRAEATPVHTLLHRPYFERSAAAVADEVDAVLIGGGDLVLPDTVSSLYWNRAWLRRPVVVSGVGVALERPSRADVLPRMRDFMQHPSVRAISLRDEESVAWARDKLQPEVPVRCAPDLGFAADLPEAAPARGSVAVVLRKTPTADDVDVVNRLRGWARSQGLGLEHLVLATGQTRDDEVRQLRTAFGDDVPLVTGDTAPGLCGLLGSYPMVFSAKFHGLVVALRYGTPVVSLRQNHKVRALARQVGDPTLADTVGPTGDPGADDDLSSLLHRRVAPATIRSLEAAAAAEVSAVLHLVGTLGRVRSVAPHG